MTIAHPELCSGELKIDGNSVDPDERPCSVVSHLCLHCLLRPVYPNTYLVSTKTQSLQHCSARFLRNGLSINCGTMYIFHSSRIECKVL